MTRDTPYYRAVYASLPTNFAAQIQALCQSTSTETLVDSLIRFVVGAECLPNASSDDRQEWADKQTKVQKALEDLRGPPADLKRPREGDAVLDSQSVKRQRKLDDSDLPLFTIHSISATSPVRKKVDITIHKSSIRFTNPSTLAIEATIPLSSLRRAFILPTRGKSKAYWTVVLLPSDTPDRSKPSTTTSQQQQQSNPQVIFGIDALAPSTLTATIHIKQSLKQKNWAKGSATLSSLHEFLSYLPTSALPVLEPSTAVFRSACAGAGAGAGSSSSGSAAAASVGSGGVPGVEAYRAAKAGTLWFMKEGILWGDSKPCEFWPVEDLLNKTEGLRLVSATGRTCSVILTRKIAASSLEDDDDDGDVTASVDGGEEGIETEFGMVDGREQQGINQWVREHRHLFGKEKVVEQAKGSGIGKNAGGTTNQGEDDSDEDDEDFEVDSDDSDGGSATSDSSEEEEGGKASGEENGMSSGDADESREVSMEGDDDDDDDLKEEKHPLMRPGAMRRMSRAAIDAVVGMVEGEVFGNGNNSHGALTSDDEEDELDD